VMPGRSAWAGSQLYHVLYMTNTSHTQITGGIRRQHREAGQNGTSRRNGRYETGRHCGKEGV
jgi:hypothetical protein